jgi:hypothetical protein
MEKSSVDHVYVVMAQLNEKERAHRKDSAEARQSRRLLKYYLYCGVVPFMLAITCAVLSHWLPAAKIAALILLVVALASVLVYPIVDAYVNRVLYRQLIRNPLGVLHANVRVASEIDADHLELLRKVPAQALAFAKFELQAERDAFERRVALVCGAIEKIGILPALAAMTATLYNVVKSRAASLEGSGVAQWVEVFAYAAIGLHVLAVGGQFLILKMDRHVKLIEFATQDPAGG